MVGPAPKVVPAGLRFGRLVTIKEVARSQSPCGNTHRRFLMLCDCGREVVVMMQNFRSGHATSCGCKVEERNHGYARTPTYKSWSQIRQRCENTNNPDYLHYGGRGITVCERWSKFGNFLTDMGICPPGLEIDRIDNEKGYEPGNCRWADRTTQMGNTRSTIKVSLDGEVMSLAAAARTLGYTHSSIREYAAARGWTCQEAIDRHYAAKRQPLAAD